MEPTYKTKISTSKSYRFQAPIINTKLKVDLIYDDFADRMSLHRRYKVGKNVKYV